MSNISKKLTKEEIQINEQTLKAYKEHVGEFYCSTCASGAGQPGATMRELRNEGYEFEMTSETRWSKKLYCEKCGRPRSHYKMLYPEPTVSEKPRCSIPPHERKRAYRVLGGKDAFSNASLSSAYEIDHKKPFSLLEQDVDIKKMTDEEIKENFQLLTPDHNKLKDKRCQKCIATGKRPDFFGLNFYYVGDENYVDEACGGCGCKGCGWYDGVAWREALNQYIKNKKDLIKTCQEYIKNKHDSNDYYLYQLIDNILHLEENCGVYDSMSV